MPLSKPNLLVALFAGTAGISVLMTVIGGILNYTPVPQMDMWASLWFFKRFNAGDWRALWEQHNEHRIVLARLLFWLDISLFKGRGLFLVIVNYLLLLLTYLVLMACLTERLAYKPNAFSRKILGLLLLTIVFSWLQQENIFWTFQSQFHFAHLLPLTAFYCLHKAVQQPTPRPPFFILSCILGICALGSMANGVMTLPLLTIMAALLRMGQRRIICLLVLSLCGIAWYSDDYHTPLTHSAFIEKRLYGPLAFLQFLLLYLGAPFYFLSGKSSTLIAQLAGLFLMVSALFFAWLTLKSPRQNSLALALLMFLLYIGGTAFATTVGRLSFGLSQAVSYRYMTPTLQAWSALLILYAPWITNGLNSHKRAYGWLLFGLQLLFISEQSSALQNHAEQQHDYLIAALAAELGIKDSQQISPIFPNASLLISESQDAIKDDLSIFNHPLIKNAEQVLAQSDTRPAASDCLGNLDSHKHLEDDPRYTRIQGWLTDVNKQVGTQPIHILNAQRQIIGYALSGQPREDVKQFVNTQTSAVGFKGYVLADYLGQAIILKGLTADCELKATLAYSAHDLFQLRLAALAALMGVHDKTLASWSTNKELTPLIHAAQLLTSTKPVVLPPPRCDGNVQSYAVLEDDPRYLRVEGQLRHANKQATPKAAKLMDSHQNNLGYILTGKSASDESPASQNNDDPAAFTGYIQSEQLGKRIILQGIEPDCTLPVTLAYLPYSIEKSVLEPQQHFTPITAVAGEHTWQKTDAQLTTPNDYRIISSFIHSSKDTGHITLKLKRGAAFFFQSGATADKQLLWINGERKTPYPLPKAIDWIILKFNMPTLADEFTATLVDAGEQSGDWSAIGLKNQQPP